MFDHETLKQVQSSVPRKNPLSYWLPNFFLMKKSAKELRKPSAKLFFQAPKPLSKFNILVFPRIRIFNSHKKIQNRNILF
jgi:hypothetical protein